MPSTSTPAPASSSSSTSSFTVSRRGFLKSGAAAGVWLLSTRAPGAGGTSSAVTPGTWCVYVAIEPDNTVVMTSPVMEMGQFMRTTGPMLIAEEMDLDWDSIRFSTEVPVHVVADDKGQLSYPHAYMSAGGSQSVVRNWDRLRRAGATARRMLVEEAAERWGVPANRLATEKNFVVDATSGRRLSYAELAPQAAHRAVDPQSVTLKTPRQHRIIGSARANIDAREIVTGKPLFGIDADYPGALQAVICRAPAWGAEPASYDRAAALAVPGVRHVIDVERIMGSHWLSGETQIVAAGVAVVADTLWAAMKGKAALRPTWKNTSVFADQDSRAQLARMTELVKEASAPVRVTMDDGDVDAALAAADLVLDHVYEKPLLAHACLEPFNCIADVRADGATIVTGTQFPSTVMRVAAQITGLDPLSIHVVPKRMGGAFGRRAETDYVQEAVSLSHRLKTPVKVTWTREDEVEQDFFDPAAVTRIRAGLRNGKLVAWHHRQAATKGGAQDSCVPARLVENYRVELVRFDSHLRAGSWRPPMHLAWSFAAESMLDELAYAAQRDPLEFRLDLMKPHAVLPFTGYGSKTIDTGRMARCYEEAARLARWDRKRPKGTGLGIAGHLTHGSYAAFVVEVSVERERLRIQHAWGAIDCGLAINPNHIANQMQGGFIDGLNAALFNRADVRDGRVVNNNFHTLRWMRMREAPFDIEVSIIPSTHEPTGVGEPPTPPGPAALANAIFAATGRRIRRLPIADEFIA